MKLLSLIAAGGLAVAAIAAPASAQHTTRVTTVNRVHGPLKFLPHHGRKICTTRIRHGVRDRRCHYH